MYTLHMNIKHDLVQLQKLVWIIHFTVYCFIASFHTLYQFSLGFVRRLPAGERTNSLSPAAAAGASTGRRHQWLQGNPHFHTSLPRLLCWRKCSLIVHAASVCVFVCRRMACSPSHPTLWRISCLCCAHGVSVLPKMSPKTRKCYASRCVAWPPWSTCCTAAAPLKGRWRLRRCSTTISSCSTGTDPQRASREMA